MQIAKERNIKWSVFPICSHPRIGRDAHSGFKYHSSPCCSSPNVSSQTIRLSYCSSLSADLSPIVSSFKTKWVWHNTLKRLCQQLANAQDTHCPATWNPAQVKNSTATQKNNRITNAKDVLKLEVTLRRLWLVPIFGDCSRQSTVSANRGSSLQHDVQLSMLLAGKWPFVYVSLLSPLRKVHTVGWLHLCAVTDAHSANPSQRWRSAGRFFCCSVEPVRLL